MSLLNTPATYGFVSKLFHWTMAIAIIGMIALGLYMEDLPPTPEKFQLIGLHKAVGALILVATFIRALWWLVEVKPTLPQTLPAWSHRWVSLGHSVLYGFMVLLPLSGWILSNAAGYPVSVFGWFELPMLVGPNPELRGMFGETHEVLANLLIVLLVLHVGAAMVHHFMFRDDTLRKMLPFGK